MVSGRVCVHLDDRGGIYVDADPAGYELLRRFGFVRLAMVDAGLELTVGTVPPKTIVRAERRKKPAPGVAR